MLRRGAKSNIPVHPKMELFSISIGLSAISLPISISMTSNLLSTPEKKDYGMCHCQVIFLCPSWIEILDRSTKNHILTNNENFMYYLPPFENKFHVGLYRAFSTRNHEIFDLRQKK